MLPYTSSYFFKYKEEGRDPYTHYLLAASAGGCFFVVASGLGCRLVEVTSTGIPLAKLAKLRFFL